MSYKTTTFMDIEGNIVTCNAESVGKKHGYLIDYFRCCECKNQVPSDAENGACHSFFDGTVIFDETEKKRYCKKYCKEQNKAGEE